MSVGYTGILWNRQKRRYDGALVAALVAGIAAYVGVSLAVVPQLTAETLVIRATALAAFVLLHVILCIGPLARLDRRWLPLLYNRRHLGVTMFLLAAVHAAVSVFQFHALGDRNPFVSVLTAYRRDYDLLDDGTSLSDFPFEPWGLFALVVLFLMAATSHDFWLKNLGASLWKALHVAVLAAYAALVVHVALGALQAERHPLLAAALTVGVAIVSTLHVWAALRERAVDRRATRLIEDGWERACPRDRLREGRGTTVHVAGERLAVFLHEGEVYALSNVCRHQGGPIAEGRILDGCVTCPWHGWQYRPDTGASPPPFEEQVETYPVRVVDDTVWIRPEPRRSA